MECGSGRPGDLGIGSVEEDADLGGFVGCDFATEIRRDDDGDPGGICFEHGDRLFFIGGEVVEIEILGGVELVDVFARFGGAVVIDEDGTDVADVEVDRVAIHTDLKDGEDHGEDKAAPVAEEVLEFFKGNGEESAEGVHFCSFFFS